MSARIWLCGVVSGALPDGLASVHIVEGLASRRARSGTGDALAEVIAELDPDVIYLHNVFDPAAVSAVATLAGRGMLIWYVHDHYLTCLSELRWRRDLGSCPQRLGHDCWSPSPQGIACFETRIEPSPRPTRAPDVEPIAGRR